MAGISDIRHELCLALALWNGADPILKERMFGLTGPQGNHGEDVKEYWWYLEGLPSHALLRWRYHYPQAAFPYEQLIDENGRGPARTPSSSCSTPASSTTTATGRSTSPTPRPRRPRCWSGSTVENHGPDEATLDVLPTLWFRNTWRSSGDDDAPGRASSATARRSSSTDHALGGLPAGGRAGPRRRAPRGALLRERDEHARGSSAPTPITPYPKDGINDHVVAGAATVNPDGFGTKAALAVPADGPRRRARPSCGCGCTGRQPRPAPPATRLVGQRVRRRRRGPRGRGGRVLRRARARRARRPSDADPPPGVRRAGLEQADVPVQRAPLARRRPGRAAAAGSHATAATAAGGTSTRSTCSRCPTRGSTRGSPPGTWPSTPWPGRTSTRRSRSTSSSCCCGSGSSTPTARSPPTSGTSTTSTRRCTCMAALRVFQIDGGRDREFLERVFQKLLVNFTWWLNRAGRRREQRVRRRLPRARQHQPDRPLEPPRRRPPRAGRRHGVDGLLRAVDARDRGRSSPRRTTSTTTW